MRSTRRSTSSSGWNCVTYARWPTRNDCTGHAVPVASSTASFGVREQASLWPVNAMNRSGHALEQRVDAAVFGQRHLHRRGRLAVGAVDQPAQVGRDHADPVAQPDQGDAVGERRVHDAAQVALDAALGVGLDLVGGVELPAADDEARIVVRPDHGQGRLLNAELDELSRLQPTERRDGVELGRDGPVVVADRQVQERLHRSSFVSSRLQATRVVPMGVGHHAGDDRAGRHARASA